MTSKAFDFRELVCAAVLEPPAALAEGALAPAGEIHKSDAWTIEQQAVAL